MFSSNYVTLWKTFLFLLPLVDCFTMPKKKAGFFFSPQPVLYLLQYLNPMEAVIKKNKSQGKKQTQSIQKE